MPAGMGPQVQGSAGDGNDQTQMIIPDGVIKEQLATLAAKDEKLTEMEAEIQGQKMHYEKELMKLTDQLERMEDHVSTLQGELQMSADIDKL